MISIGSSSMRRVTCLELCLDRMNIDKVVKNRYAGIGNNEEHIQKEKGRMEKGGYIK